MNSGIFKNKTILMIDDDEVNHLYIETILAKSGCNIISAYDSCDGIKQFKKHDIDLVLLDFNLPKMNGYDVLKKLKTYKEDVEVIMVSGETDKQEISYERGALAYITKPFTPKKLRDTIKFVFDIKKLEMI